MYRLLIFFVILIQCYHSITVRFLNENQTQTVDPDLEKVQNYANTLFTTLMLKYDKAKPSHVPVVFYTYMVIDNLKDFNEVDMTMRMQATYIINWMDKRLIWESTDFGNLTKIVIPTYKLRRLWIPQIILKSIMPSKTTIIQSTNTELLITSSGNVFAATKLSTPITCDTQLENYPYDKPNCSLYILCGESSGERNTVLFGNMNYVTDRNNFFNGNNITRHKQFAVLNFTSQRYYVTTDGVRIQDSEEPNYISPPRKEQAGKRITTLGSFMHYQFYFERNVITYSSTVLIPLYIGTLLMLISTDIDNVKLSLILMILTLFFQYLTMTRISFSLPPNYLTTPFCMRYATIIFIETILLFMFRLAYGYLLQAYEDDLKVMQTLMKVKRYFRYFLLLELIYCTFLLLFF